MVRREPAELFFGGDFYDDEHVLRMSYEEQGVYRRLLWISRQNGSIPDDPKAIAELLRLPCQGLTVRRFVSKVWPKVLPCWTPANEGRLIQRRQEEERQIREANRGAAGPEAGEPGSRSEQMRALAQKRWDAVRNAAACAPADARRNAEADASRNAAASLPPAPPSVQVQENQPQSARARAHGADADADARPHADAASTSDPVLQLHRVLVGTSLRSGMRGLDRSIALREMAEHLVETGLQPQQLRELWVLAQAKAKPQDGCAEADPGALLSHWLIGDGIAGGWREVLDEQRMKAKEAALAGRAKPEADVLSGVYGS